MQILAFATAFVGSCALVVGFDFLVLAKIDQRFVDWISPQVTHTDTTAGICFDGRGQALSGGWGFLFRENDGPFAVDSLTVDSFDSF